MKDSIWALNYDTKSLMIPRDAAPSDGCTLVIAQGFQAGIMHCNPPNLAQDFHNGGARDEAQNIRGSLSRSNNFPSHHPKFTLYRKNIFF